MNWKEANLKREQQESAAASKSAMELTGYYADYVNNNPDLLEKLDALALKVDELFDDQELMDEMMKREYNQKNPEERNLSLKSKRYPL